MGKMVFGKGEKKQVSIGAPSPQTKVVEKIVEVPVEVEVIKEVIVPQNTEIPAKFDDAAVEALRVDTLKRITEVNNKVTSQKAKLQNICQDYDARLKQQAEKRDEEHKDIHQKVFLQKNAVEKLAQAQKLEVEEIEALQNDVIELRKCHAKDHKIMLALGIGLLITTLLHLL